MRNLILVCVAFGGLAACTTAETSNPAFDLTQQAYVTDSRLPVVAVGYVAEDSGCSALVVC